MPVILKQYVPQKVCLTCDGCCRFKEEGSAWRPKMGLQEIIQAGNGPLINRIFSKEKIDSKGYLKAVSCQGQYLCSFFNLKENTCRIYKGRPFECQLYPFLLTKGQNSEANLCVHLNCPHIRETKDTEAFREYVKYLREYFIHEDTRSFLKENPNLISDYSQYQEEMEVLFPIPLNHGTS